MHELSKWSTANVDDILAIDGAENLISKEELYLDVFLLPIDMIGMLEAQDYALFVSHEHSDGQVDSFNVFPAVRTGRPWGEFWFSTELSASFVGGLSYGEPVITL
ncbi:hypothetical protein C8Q79DRAFT_1010863 [Trametes meyenii]|nr:hypothetical protein C8Q79DRAFT_1010863 [Trametes meyenii]